MAPTAATVRPSDRTLRWAITEPHSLVPAQAVAADELLVVDALFDSLTAWDSDLLVRPSVAARWATPDGGRTWVFTLRPQRRFSDGSPVRAEDFVTAWNAVAAGIAHHHLRDVVGYADVRAGRRSTLAGVTAVARRTLSVRLTSPRMDFPAIVAHPALAPVPSAAWRADRQAFTDSPVGNGPFRMAEPWARGRFVRLAPVDPPPATRSGEYVPQEVLLTSTDPATAYVAFSQGRVDVTALPPGAIDDAQEAIDTSPDGYTGPGLLRGDTAATTMLVFDLRRPPFDEVDVRRAVSLALRRSRLADESVSGGALPARSLVPPSVPGARQRSCLDCRTDEDEARELFARHGVVSLPLWFAQGGGHERLASAIAGDLARVGVDVQARPLPFADYTAALRRGGPGLFRLAWVLDYPTQDNALWGLVHSSQRPRAGGSNYGRYRDAEVDALLEQARAAADASERTDLLRAAEDIVIGRDMAVVPVLTHRHRMAVGQRVRYLRVSPLGTADLAAVRLVEVPADDA